MAITLTAVGGVAYDKLSVTFVDNYRNSRSVTYPIAQAAAEADVITMLTALDAITQAQLCQVTRGGSAFDIDGQEASGTGAFSSTYDRAELDYVSADRCKDSVTVTVPAPIPAIFTGQAKQIIDPNNAALQAFNTALEAILIHPKSGATDLAYNVGYRAVDALPKPTVF